MAFDYKKNLEESFKNHIFSSTDPIERHKDVVISVVKIFVEKKKSITGFLRFQSVKQKILQYYTQSLEIKTGDMLEEFFDKLLASKYIKLDKNISYNEKSYKCDQLVQEKTGNRDIIFIEQKIRDNHDSTKKDGQADNFEEKIKAIKHNYPSNSIKAYEWFIDVQYKKYTRYYQQRINNFLSENPNICSAELVYGEAIIENLIGTGSWQEFVDAYNEVKASFISDISSDIEYDFDKDESGIVFNYFKTKRIKAFDVFFTDDYSEVRKAFFKDGIMVTKLNSYFSEKKNSKSQTSIEFRKKYKALMEGN